MYREINDFITDWSYESGSTINVFKNISNEALNRKGHENVRSMAVLTWHITITLSEMLKKAGLDVSGPDEHSAAPSDIHEIIEAYEKSAQSVSEQVKKQWLDSNLPEEVPMYGETWKKGVVLAILIRHQAHHRGQLTILMRHAGLKVPGVYGPSKEEWLQMNMPPME
ncbi:MAG: DinB family protein [Bacteroidota bacterium]|nr:DinB family protein [Bacteroidota bacterium]